jgi:phenylalanyl-tRNA synthetase alpha subunit
MTARNERDCFYWTEKLHQTRQVILSRHIASLDLRRFRRRTEVKSLAKRGGFASYRLIAAVEIGA